MLTITFVVLALSIAANGAMAKAITHKKTDAFVLPITTIPLPQTAELLTGAFIFRFDAHIVIDSSRQGWHMTMKGDADGWALGTRPGFLVATPYRIAGKVKLSHTAGKDDTYMLNCIWKLDLIGPNGVPDMHVVTKITVNSDGKVSVDFRKARTQPKQRS